jgi:5-(carboxyamino)imidazole ribonucleotide mutase
VSIGGGRNAGLLAVKILATSDPALSEALARFSADLEASVEQKNQALKSQL